MTHAGNIQVRRYMRNVEGNDWSECRTKSQYKDWQQPLWKGGTVQIFGNKLNRSKFYSGRFWKSRLKTGNNCYHSAQNLLSSSLLKNLKTKIYRNIILPVFLYGWETWSLTLREKRRLRESGNRVFRKIFGPMRDEVTREWRKLHNEELNDMYCSPNIVRVIKSRRRRWVWNVASSTLGTAEVYTGFWWGNPREKRPWKTQA